MIPASSFTINSNIQITAVVPAASATGFVDVRVNTSAGSSPVVTADHYTYTAQTAPTLTAISSASGSTGAGATFTITGTDFAGALYVQFGGILASQFTVNSDTSI